MMVWLNRSCWSNHAMGATWCHPIPLFVDPSRWTALGPGRSLADHHGLQGFCERIPEIWVSGVFASRDCQTTWKGNCWAPSKPPDFSQVSNCSATVQCAGYFCRPLEGWANVEPCGVTWYWGCSERKPAQTCPNQICHWSHGSMKRLAGALKMNAVLTSKASARPFIHSWFPWQSWQQHVFSRRPSMSWRPGRTWTFRPAVQSSFLRYSMNKGPCRASCRSSMSFFFDGIFAHWFDWCYFTQRNCPRRRHFHVWWGPFETENEAHWNAKRQCSATVQCAGYFCRPLEGWANVEPCGVTWYWRCSERKSAQTCPNQICHWNHGSMKRLAGALKMNAVLTSKASARPFIHSWFPWQSWQKHVFSRRPRQLVMVRPWRPLSLVRPAVARGRGWPKVVRPYSMNLQGISEVAPNGTSFAGIHDLWSFMVYWCLWWGCHIEVDWCYFNAEKLSKSFLDVLWSFRMTVGPFDPVPR